MSIHNIADVEVENINPIDNSISNIKISSFWKDDSVIIMFLRRFGCKLCRYACQEISTLYDKLKEKNIRLIAISFDKEGVNDFIKGQYFKGEIYLDPNRNCYKGLNYKKKGLLEGFGMFDSKMYEAIKKAGNVEGNFQGDGMQLGGTFIIEKGGNVLLDHRQKYFGDNVELNIIKEIFNLD